ncbi:hypothetical protein OIU79_001748 [Salix purpurea]|uniref:Uncharacterized protein n=1 Tax=Salix purpurea TaxID=77065 RepID=A0A9Q0UR39_SALPP|nr:hypothetical protein OIU79_001748 [Salix purpurea]
MKIARLGLFGSDQELFLLLYWKVKVPGFSCFVLDLELRNDLCITVWLQGKGGDGSLLVQKATQKIRL